MTPNSTFYDWDNQVPHNRPVTVLSARDCTTFLKLLDGKGPQPNAALRKAAARYKKQSG